MVNEIDQLVEISRRLGTRLDLIQAGGGNTSVKTDGQLYIKASGATLKDMTADKLAVLDLVTLAALNPDGPRPSMESGMHQLLPKFVVHTHAIDLNVWLCSDLPDEALEARFSQYQPLIIPYVTPGVDLAAAIKTAWRNQTKTIFLRNHGLITVSDKATEAAELTELVAKTARELITQSRPDQPEFGPNELSELPNDFLFPDAAVFGDDLASLTSDQKIILSANNYLLDTITALGLTPAFLTEVQIATLRGLDAEKYRRQLNSKVK